MALTERLVLPRELMEREGVRVKNREYTFKENITKNGIKVGMFEITAKISD